MRFALKTILVLSLMLPTLASCQASKTGLTRAQALALLNKPGNFHPYDGVTDGIPDHAINNAIQDGILELPGQGNCPPTYRPESMSGAAVGCLTAKGKEYFTYYHYWRPTFASPKTPIKRKVTKITGILFSPAAFGGPPSAEVEFEWQFVDIPDAITRYTGLAAGNQRLGRGKVVLTLYDDGWRITQTNY